MAALNTATVVDVITAPPSLILSCMHGLMIGEQFFHAIVSTVTITTCMTSADQTATYSLALYIIISLIHRKSCDGHALPGKCIVFFFIVITSPYAPGGAQLTSFYNIHMGQR